MTAVPIGSPCGRTKLYLPLGPSATPTDQIIILKAHSPRSQRSAMGNASDFFSPISASGRRPLTSFEKEHWTVARNANSPNGSPRMETARGPEGEKGSKSGSSPILSTARLPSIFSQFKDGDLEQAKPDRTSAEQEAIDEAPQKPEIHTVLVPQMGKMLETLL